MPLTRFCTCHGVCMCVCERGKMETGGTRERKRKRVRKRVRKRETGKSTRMDTTNGGGIR